MPNTNPSDLDREALEPCPFCGGVPETHYHYDGMDIYGVGCGGHAGFSGETLKEAAMAWNTRSLPRASGVPEAELRESFNAGVAWQKEMEAPPVVAPSGEALRYAAQFLIDRLEDFELDETNAKEMCRQYLGFVEPAIARLQMALASPIASEPKDAEGGTINDGLTCEWPNCQNEARDFCEKNRLLEAILATKTKEEARFNKEFSDAEFARDEAGYTGTIGNCIRELSQSLDEINHKFHAKDAGSGEGQETDGAFLARIGTDGAKWAAEFIKISDKLGHKGIDEGWMIGWFANAIEAGRSAGHAEKERHELTREEAMSAMHEIGRYGQASDVYIRHLYYHSFAITRTAPSGAKPGEVG